MASCQVDSPEEPAAYLIGSEYTTLKVLETTTVPAPRAFACGMRGDGTDRGIGVRFLFMEELPGTPWYGDRPGGQPAASDANANVRRAYAGILAELARHPFSKAGSLYLDDAESIKVSAMASDRFAVLSPEGPFATATEYCAAFAEQHLSLISDGQLYTEYPVNAYLVYRFIKDKAADLAQSTSDAFLVLVAALKEQIPGLGQHTADERLRRFVWGLAHEPKWEDALPLAKALQGIFGIEQVWGAWRETTVQNYETDECLRRLVLAEKSVAKSALMITKPMLCHTLLRDHYYLKP